MSLTATFEPAPALRLVAWSGTFRVSRWLSTMDAMTLDRWVPFRNERAAIRCRLFAFPHAGGNAAFYRPLRRFMPPEIDLCPVELPGRAARLDEPPFVSMSALMEELRHALQPLMAVPFGFFGHSVGSWMAYEAARQLRSLDGRTAIHLFVSGRRSPRPCARALSPATPSIRPRTSRHSGPIWRHPGGNHGAPGAARRAAAGVASRSCPRGRVFGRSRASYRLSDHRPRRRRRPVRFRRHSILERVHPRKIPDSSFPWRAFLHLNGRRGSHQVNSSRTCTRPWACPRRVRGRSYDRLLRRSSRPGERRNPCVDCPLQRRSSRNFRLAAAAVGRGARAGCAIRIRARPGSFHSNTWHRATHPRRLLRGRRRDTGLRK